MAVALSVNTKFTASDNMTATFKKMAKSVGTFGMKAGKSINLIDRNVGKLTKGLKAQIGVVGKLGLAYGGLEIGRSILNSNKDLEASLASLSSITGVVGPAFNKYKEEITKVSEAQKLFSGDVADAFAVVGSQRPELLSSAEAMSRVTNAAITLKKASGGELTTSTEALTLALNQFNLAADQSDRIINTLAAGSQKGSGNIQFLTDAMEKSGTTANLLGINIETWTGAIESIAPFYKQAATAGNSFDKSLLILREKQIGFTSGTFNMLDALEELEKMFASGKTSTDIFGKEHSKMGDLLVANKAKFIEYTKAVTGTNIAEEQAAINTSTLAFGIEELVAAWKNAVSSTNENNAGLSILKGTLKFVADNMSTIVGIAGTFVVGFLALKTAVLVTSAVTAIYNIALGVQAASLGILIPLTHTSTAAIIGNRIAIMASSAATWLYNTALSAGSIITNIATIATTGLGIAMNFALGPILLVIGAIAAIAAVFVFWDDIVSAFTDTWDSFMSIFSSDEIGKAANGALGDLDDVGVDVKATTSGGIGTETQDALDKLNKASFDINSNVNSDDTFNNPEATASRVISENVSKTEGAVDITIKDQSGAAEVSDSSGAINVVVEPVIK